MASLDMKTFLFGFLAGISIMAVAFHFVTGQIRVRQEVSYIICILCCSNKCPQEGDGGPWFLLTLSPNLRMFIPPFVLCILAHPPLPHTHPPIRLEPWIKRASWKTSNPLPTLRTIIGTTQGKRND